MAQPGRGGFDRGGGGIGALLMSDAVRSEVGIEPEQMEELQVMRDEIRDQMREQFSGMRDMSPEERQAAMSDMRAKMEEIRADAEKRLEGVLTEGQISRLKQINLQQQMQRGGTRGLLRGPVAEKLGITEQQQEEMRQKAEEEQAKLQEQIRKLTQESRDRVLSVLTDSQRSQLKQMMGEQFDMPRNDFQRGRGPRGGQQGGRPQRGARPELE